MSTLAICFLYHGKLSDPVTAKHIAAIDEAAPDATLVPLSFAVVPGIPTNPIGHVPQNWTVEKQQWHCCDLPFWYWFRRNRPNFDRYLVVEYDTLITQHPREFFAKVWDENVVGANIMGDDWGWWCAEPQLSAKIPDYAKWGLMPMFMLLKHEAASAMCDILFAPGAGRLLGFFSECRIGVLARLAGFTPVSFSDDPSYHVGFGPITPNGPGIWHPVKA